MRTLFFGIPAMSFFALALGAEGLMDRGLFWKVFFAWVVVGGIMAGIGRLFPDNLYKR